MSSSSTRRSLQGISLKENGLWWAYRAAPAVGDLPSGGPALTRPLLQGRPPVLAIVLPAAQSSPLLESANVTSHV